MTKFSEKAGYGFGDMASSMFWKIFSYYLPFFYSNVFGLRLRDAALLLLVTKMYDAVTDPLMGVIADRTRTRWGRFRPWLLWMALPFALVGVLTFTTPEWSYGWKLVWAYATYLAMMTAYTAINVPYGAMLGVVTEDSKEKTVFSSFRMFFAYAGSFLAIALFEPLVKALGGGSLESPGGWQMSMVVIGAIVAVMFWICFAMTREHVKPAGEATRGSIGRDLRNLVGNGPWWALSGAAIGVLLFNSIRGGAAAYFFKDFVGGAPLMSNVIFTAGLFLAVGEIANMLGVVLAVPLSKRFGKKRAYCGSMIVAAVLSAVFFFVPATAAGYWTMLGLQVVISVAAGVVLPLLWSMYADVADYSELKHGRASTGLIFSSSSMAQKFGGAFGSALILWLLAAFGYDTAADAVQSAGAVTGTRLLMSWIPAAGCLVAAAAMMFFPLGERRIAAQELAREMERELTGDILPWWSRRMLDPAGGFHGRITGDGKLDAAAPRGAVMNARILWTFSAAYRLLGKPEYLETATHAKRYLIEKFYDHEHGGVYWTVGADGKPLDTKKQFYALGFALYGLSEYARATGDREALEYAQKLFESIEAHSFDPVRGGYIEACTREWGEIADPRLSERDHDAPKTMNTHLHILEAYTNLHRVWPEAKPTAQLRGLIELFMDRIEQPSGHLGLFFDNEWRLGGGSAGGVSYGHDIEASWLLLEAALELGDDTLTARVEEQSKKIALAALEGLNPDGSMNYHLDPDGRLDGERHWWVQAEAVVGQFYLWRHHDMAEGLDGARRTWDYIRQHLLDAEGGEWWWSADENGNLNRDDDKAGLWKCPYHNGRMCMEIIFNAKQ